MGQFEKQTEETNERGTATYTRKSSLRAVRIYSHSSSSQNGRVYFLPKQRRFQTLRSRQTELSRLLPWRRKDTSRRVVPTLFSDSLLVFKANRFKTDTGIIRGSIERINIEMDGPHPGPLTQSRNAFLSLDFPSTLPETPRPPCIRRIRAGKKRYLNNKLISSRHRDDRVYIVGGR